MDDVTWTDEDIDPEDPFWAAMLANAKTTGLTELLYGTVGGGDGEAQSER